MTATSVARVARAHGVNAKQVFYWRKLYQKRRLGAIHGGKLLQLPRREKVRRPLLGKVNTHLRAHSHH